MASTAIRLRRSLSLSPVFLNHSSATSTAITTPSSSSILRGRTSSSTKSAKLFPAILSPLTRLFSRSFHSTNPSSYASRSYIDDDNKIDPDTILFEGCDYKHWLITMDFPKDPKPSPEEMVETYVQTLAKVVGSVEEAKKRMYACSTTTYHGFQAEIDEETAMKFEGMPGVVFVLPDSYIDPVNKEYGGDKYINGTIIPRPPPVQYGRQRRSRPRDPTPNYEGNPGYDQQRSMQGDGRSYMPQQNPPSQQYSAPQQNYAPPGQGERRNPMPMNRMDYQGGGRPPYQGNYNQGNYHPEQQRGYPSGDQRGFAPQGPREFTGGNQNYGQRENYQGNYNQGNFHPEQRGYPPGDQRGFAPQGQREFTAGNQNYSPPPPPGGAFGQGGAGSHAHGGTGPYGPGTSGGYVQGGGSGYGPGFPAHGDNPRYPQAQNGQQNNQQYAPTGQTGTKQGTY
ncbi:hypothetical protein Ancab_002787 [Ancistrocladus abbreviatus]